MKKILSVVIVLLMVALVSAQAQSTQYGAELRVSANGALPQFDLYDYAYGLDFQYRNWFWDPVGFALGAGVTSYRVKNNSSAVYSALIKNVDGELTAIPVGPSIIYKIADVSDWNLTAEAGVRFVFAQSAVTYRRKDTDSGGTMDIDNGVIGVLGLDYERFFGDSKSFFVGAGYQFDIDGGTISISDASSVDNKLEAFFARVGTKIQF